MKHLCLGCQEEVDQLVGISCGDMFCQDCANDHYSIPDASCSQCLQRVDKEFPMILIPYNKEAIEKALDIRDKIMKLYTKLNKPLLAPVKRIIEFAKSYPSDLLKLIPWAEKIVIYEPEKAPEILNIIMTKYDEYKHSLNKSNIISVDDISNKIKGYCFTNDWENRKTFYKNQRITYKSELNMNIFTKNNELIISSTQEENVFIKDTFIYTINNIVSYINRHLVIYYDDNNIGEEKYEKYEIKEGEYNIYENRIDMKSRIGIGYHHDDPYELFLGKFEDDNLQIIMYVTHLTNFVMKDDKSFYVCEQSEKKLYVYYCEMNDLKKIKLLSKYNYETDSDCPVNTLFLVGDYLIHFIYEHPRIIHLPTLSIKIEYLIYSDPYNFFIDMYGSFIENNEPYIYYKKSTDDINTLYFWKIEEYK